MREPDLSSDTVKAWLIPITKESVEGHTKEWGAPPAHIATWIVTGPFHMFWQWWMVAVIHLRDIPGAPPPHKQYLEAEYEFMILSMNPDPGDRPNVPDIDALDRGENPNLCLPGFLSPPDAVVHFHGVDDEQAAEVARLSVAAIVNGYASPDSDFRSWWKTAIPNTVKHLRGEEH